MNHEDSIVTTITTQKTTPVPRRVTFIILTIFFERFSNFIFTFLIMMFVDLFYKFDRMQKILMSHVFGLVSCLSCTVFAFVADSCLGKFQVVLLCLLTYFFGLIGLILAAVLTANEISSSNIVLWLAVVLVSLGFGGMRAPTPAIGGDQFQLPQESQELSMYFILVYLASTFAQLLSMVCLEVFRSEFNCGDEPSCYIWIFVLPALLITVSIAIFVSGHKYYKIEKPTQNLFVLMFGAMIYALRQRIKNKYEYGRTHWLDYAVGKYDQDLIEDVKTTLRILILFSPFPIFFALFDQQTLHWTFQAMHMNGQIGMFDIKPEQMQIFNPAYVLILLPIVYFLIYPGMSFIGFRQLSDRMAFGALLIAGAFLMSAFLDYQVRDIPRDAPGKREAHLRLFNGEECEFSVMQGVPGTPTFFLQELGFFLNKYIRLMGASTSYPFAIESSSSNCESIGSVYLEMTEGKAYGLFIASKISTSGIIWYEDYLDYTRSSLSSIRVLANINSSHVIKWQKHTGRLVHLERPTDHNLLKVEPGYYVLYIDNRRILRTHLNGGTLYTVIISEPKPDLYRKTLNIVGARRRYHMLWQTPQYLLMAMGEVMFIINGMEFSYLHSPKGMKTIVNSIWFGTIGGSHLIIIVIASLNIIESHSYLFFSGLIVIFVMIFVILDLSYRKKGLNDPLSDFNF